MKCVVRDYVSVPVDQMEDGDLAVITEWTIDRHIGEVVQRYEDVLIGIGQPNTAAWSEILGGNNSNCRVRLLKAGESIEILD